MKRLPAITPEHADILLDSLRADFKDSLDLDDGMAGVLAEAYRARVIECCADGKMPTPAEVAGPVLLDVARSAPSLVSTLVEPVHQQRGGQDGLQVNVTRAEMLALHAIGHAMTIPSMHQSFGAAPETHRAAALAGFSATALASVKECGQSIREQATEAADRFSKGVASLRAGIFGMAGRIQRSINETLENADDLLLDAAGGAVRGTAAKWRAIGAHYDALRGGAADLVNGTRLTIQASAREAAESAHLMRRAMVMLMHDVADSVRDGYREMRDDVVFEVAEAGYAVKEGVLQARNTVRDTVDAGRQAVADRIQGVADGIAPARKGAPAAPSHETGFIAIPSHPTLMRVMLETWDAHDDPAQAMDEINARIPALVAEDDVERFLLKSPEALQALADTYGPWLEQERQRAPLLGVLFTGTEAVSTTAFDERLEAFRNRSASNEFVPS